MARPRRDTRRQGRAPTGQSNSTGEQVMISRQGGLVALLLGIWSAAVLAEVPAPDSTAARHEAQRLAELPRSSPWLAGSTRQGASSKDASRTTAGSLPIGKWRMAGQ